MASLIIIAGPNGAGKSTSSTNLLKPYGITAFDFDKEFYKQWSTFDFDPYVEQGVKQSTMDKFHDHLKSAFSQKKDVAFETNFNNEITLTHVKDAKRSGMNTKLVFIGLESIELAVARVAERVKNGGHPVSKSTIRERYYAGLRLLDEEFAEFDQVFIHESPPDYKPLIKCIAIDNTGILQLNKPSFIQYLPNIQKEIQKNKNKDRGISF